MDAEIPRSKRVSNSNTLRRLLESIGLQRRTRNLNPTLGELVLEHQQNKHLDEGADD
jgi:hypothetical protein